MPGQRTYQTIGYATYHGGRLYGRRKRPELERAAAKGAAVLVAAALVAGVATQVMRRSGRMPTV